jgi:uncharacterized protein (TIGR03435 family)
MAILRVTTWFSVCSVVSVFGQVGPGQRFEVASIRPSSADTGSSGIKTGHGRLDAQNVAVKRCVMGAYGIGPHQISGGPAWFDTERFDITAKVDQPIDDDAVLMIMLQKLLEERFNLMLHHEVKQMSALVLQIAGNGPKLERAADGEAGTNTSGTNASVIISAHNTGMDLFAKVLAREMELPVVNQTGLHGVFNFKLSWARENATERNAVRDGPSIFTAVQEQLGLQLRSQKAAVDLFVIDHLEMPSEN